MNAWFDAAGLAEWRLAGWTMLHFLWLGTAAALVGTVVRIACRRARPNVRYGVSLGTLAVLAALPVGVAAWLAASPEYAEWKPPALPVDEARADVDFLGVPRPSRGLSEAGLGHDADGATAPLGESVGVAATSEGLTPSPALPARGRGPEETAQERVATVDDSGRELSTLAPLDRIVGWLPVAWLVGAPLTFAWLAVGLVGSRRLRSSSVVLVEGPVVEACRRLERSLGVARRAALAACDRIAQPVLVGIVRPTILLPAAALTGWTPEELEMVLLHELAHVRRWDNLINFVQRVVEAALFFHPCVWLVSRQVRRDREECCDALVVRHTERPEEYASLLVSIAMLGRGRRMTPLATAQLASAMANQALAGRLRRILKLEDDTMRVRRGTVAMTAAALVSVAIAFCVLPARGGAATDETVADEAAAAGKDNKDRAFIVVYKIDDERVGLRDWLKLTKSLQEQGVEIQWLDAANGNDGMAVSTTRQGHDRVRQFLDRMRQQAAAGGARLDDEPRDMTGGIARYAIPQGDGRKLEQFKALLKAKGFSFTTKGSTNGTYYVEVTIPAEKLLGEIGANEIDSAGTDLEAVLENVKDDLKKKLDELKAKVTVSGHANFEEFELPKLKADIAQIQSQIFELDKQLADIEVMRQVAIAKAQSPQALEKAVEADSQVQDSYKALMQLEAKLENTRQKFTKDAPILKQIREQIEQVRATLDSAKEEARKQLAKVPNDALRATIVEYNVRKQMTLAKKKELIDKLNDAEKLIKEMAVVDPELEMLEQAIRSQQALVANLEQKIIELRAVDKHQKGSGNKKRERGSNATSEEGNDEGRKEGHEVGQTSDHPAGDTANAQAAADDEAQRVVDPFSQIAGRSNPGNKLTREALSEALAAAKEDLRKKLEELKARMSAGRDGDSTQVDLPKLKADIGLFQSQLIELEKDLAESKSFPGTIVPNNPHNQRLLAEKKELTDKLNEAEKFIKDRMITNLELGRLQEAIAAQQELVARLEKTIAEWRAAQLQLKDAGENRDVEKTAPTEEGGDAGRAEGEGAGEAGDRAAAEAARAAEEAERADVDAAQAGDEAAAAEAGDEPAEGEDTAAAGGGDAPARLGPYRLRAGDVVRVRTVATEPGSPPEDPLIVEEEGTLALGPIVGRVKVVGLTLAEAEAAVTKLLATIYKEPRVQITLVETRDGRRVGPYRLRPADEIGLDVRGALPDAPLGGNYVVEDEGTLALGATYGRVDVAGLTVLEAERAVKKALAEVITDPVVQITLRKKAPPDPAPGKGGGFF